MSANVNAKPIGLMAPWWSDFNKATADQRVTKREVKKLISAHADTFKDKSYRAALEGLLKFEGKDDVYLTRGAKAELKGALAGANHPQIWWPTKDQLTQTYGSIVRQALEDGRAKPLSAPPKGWERAPSYDITPKGLLGSRSTVYNVDGRLYLVEAAVRPGVKGSWFDCGPAPMF